MATEHLTPPKGHLLRRLAFALLTALFLAAFIPNAQAHPETSGKYRPKVERWRGEVRHELKRYGVWSTRAENTLLNIIQHESGGAPAAGTKRHTACIGLVQFNSGWHQSRAEKRAHRHHKRHARPWRECGPCSIRRCARSLHDGGWGAWITHWRATWAKR